MTYVGQFANNGIPSAGDLNALFPTCVLYKTTAQTLAGNTDVTLTWTAAGDEIRDPLGWHSTSTNATRVTVSLAGLYRIVGNLQANGNLGNGARLYIRKNGTTTLAMEAADQAATAANSAFSITWTGILAANDYVELLIRNNQATSRSSSWSGLAAVYLSGGS